MGTKSWNIRSHFFSLQQIASVKQFVIYFVDDRTLPIADEIDPDRFGNVTCQIPEVQNICQLAAANLQVIHVT